MATAAQLAHWRDFWGDQGDRSNPFGSPGKVYTKGYHRGEDVSNHGKPETVPCLRPGRVVWAGRSNLIGFYVVVDPDGDDRYDIYCHMHEGSAKRTGKVAAGDPLGRTADWGEDPGGGWDGPHLHFVVADAVAGGYDVRIREYDPRPIIAAALRGGAPAGSEEDEMSAESERQIEFIYKALGGPNNGPNAAKELNWTDVDGNKRTARYGVLDIVTENQNMLRTLAKAVKDGFAALAATLTAVRNTQGGHTQSLDAIKTSGPAAIDYTKLAEEIVKAGGTAPTPAQIAKAVNDDADARSLKRLTK